MRRWRARRRRFGLGCKGNYCVRACPKPGRNRPPRWHEHWGPQWRRQREGWDRLARTPAPPPAPLPSYQRKFPNERYPQPEQQPTLHGQNYRYQPREPVVQQMYQERARAPTAVPRKREQPEHGRGPDRDKDDGPGRGHSK